MAVMNNLYPGIVDAYMPAFLVDDAITRVYFSISAYNSFDDIKNTQVTIVSQKTNLTVLDDKLYPSSIMLKPIYEDLERKGNDRYYFEISANDLKDKEFLINQYYKVQFRFTGNSASNISLETPQALDSWLISNKEHFSEWSTVCLISGISTPILSIKNFDTLATESIWTTSNIKLVGRIDFVDPAENETLMSYQIKLYRRLNNELLTDSGLIYADNENNLNEFIYSFNYLFVNKEQYYFTIDFTTQNLYKESQTFNFKVQEDSSIEFSLDSLTIEKDEENGLLAVRIISGNPFEGTLAISRASSLTNFTIWEDVYTEEISTQLLSVLWKDRTVESGVLYKYGVRKRDPLTNTQSVMIKTGNPEGVIFEYSYLTQDNQQLKIKFNNGVSSFKRNISDTKINTIGSEFPFIIRNGNVKYRSFSISGLISFLTDEEEFFISRNKLLGVNNIKAYDAFNQENGITQYNDYYYERVFREAVMDFLYKNDVKLFRSPTEGNILVRLTDVSFNPENTLGRYIWNFSCNAFEIDSNSIEKYNEYNIQKIER